MVDHRVTKIFHWTQQVHGSSTISMTRHHREGKLSRRSCYQKSRTFPSDWSCDQLHPHRPAAESHEWELGELPAPGDHDLRGHGHSDGASAEGTGQSLQAPNLVNRGLPFLRVHVHDLLGNSSVFKEEFNPAGTSTIFFDTSVNVLPQTKAALVTILWVYLWVRISLA